MTEMNPVRFIFINSKGVLKDVWRGIVVKLLGCHPRDPGSIPGVGG